MPPRQTKKSRPTPALQATDAKPVEPSCLLDGATQPSTACDKGSTTVSSPSADVVLERPPHIAEATATSAKNSVAQQDLCPQAIKRLKTAKVAKPPDINDAPSVDNETNILTSTAQTPTSASQSGNELVGASSKAKPKRSNTGAFNMFQKEFYATNQDAMIGSDAKTKTKMCGDAWSCLSDIDKAKYDTKPKVDRRTSAPKKTGNNRTTSFFLYVAEVRVGIKQANPSLGASQIASKAGEMWRALDDATRQQYSKMATAVNIERDKVRNANTVAVASMDATNDASVDAANDASVDAANDASMDTTTDDASVNTTTDAMHDMITITTKDTMQDADLADVITPP